MSSLDDLSEDTREIVRPNRAKNVILRRPISTTNTVTDTGVEIKGYSNSYGGQLVDNDFEEVEKEINGDGDLEITIPSPEVGGDQGGDYLIEYSVEDDTGAADVGKFFYQNGVYRDSDAGNLTNRVSAELERLSGTFSDGQQVEEATNFADISSDNFISMSRLNYNANGANLFNKHNGEPIPYFEGAGTVNFQDQAFSSRESTSIVVLQWNQNFDEIFPVARVSQGENNYLEIFNGKNYIEIRSDFADSIVYEQFTHTSNIAIIACRIDPASGEVFGSVNGEITGDPVPLTGEPFDSGDNGGIGLDPEGQAGDLKLFDLLTYDEALPDEELDRILKQLGYFYVANLAMPNEDTKGRGSPKIENHLLYNEDVMKYDVLAATSPTTSYDFSSDSKVLEWTHSREAASVAFNSHRKSAVGTTGNDVLRLTSNGELIWEYEGHSDRVSAVECGAHENVYSGSEDGTVKKIGRRGDEIWNFNAHTASVTDVALFRDLAVYSASEDNSVRRIIENDGSEDTTGGWPFTGHLDTVNCLEVDKSEKIYTGAANGEFRVIDNDGNEAYIETLFGGSSIEDLAVRNGNVYAISGNEIKKLQASNGDEDWNQTAEDDSTLEAVAVHPGGHVFVSDTTNNLIIEFDDTGSKVTDFTIQRPAFDLSIQPGTFEPHWKS
mgnify:FL=1